MRTVTVKYDIASYSGEIHFSCDEDADKDEIIQKAKYLVKKNGGSLPYGYESFRIIEDSNKD